MKKKLFVLFFLVLVMILQSFGSRAVKDSDEDGVPDCDGTNVNHCDLCPNSQTSVVDQHGCSCGQKSCPSDNNPCTDDCTIINNLPACKFSNNDHPCNSGYCSGGTCHLSDSQKQKTNIIILENLRNLYSPSVMTVQGVKKMWTGGWLADSDPNDFLNSINKNLDLTTIPGADKIFYSEWNGLSWSFPVLSFQKIGYHVNDPSVIRPPSSDGIDRSQWLYMYYTALDNRVATSGQSQTQENIVGFAYSADGGKTWTDLGIVINKNEGGDSFGAWSPSAVLSPNNDEIWVYYHTGTPDFSKPITFRLRFSPDGHTKIGAPERLDFIGTPYPTLLSNVDVQKQGKNYAMAANTLDLKNIVRYTSTNGLAWTYDPAQGNPLLTDSSALVLTPHQEILSDTLTRIYFGYDSGSGSRSIKSLDLTFSLAARDHSPDSDGAKIPVILSLSSNEIKNGENVSVSVSGKPNSTILFYVEDENGNKLVDGLKAGPTDENGNWEVSVKVSDWQTGGYRIYVMVGGVNSEIVNFSILPAVKVPSLQIEPAIFHNGDTIHGIISKAESNSAIQLYVYDEINKKFAIDGDFICNQDKICQTDGNGFWSTALTAKDLTPAQYLISVAVAGSKSNTVDIEVPSNQITSDAKTNNLITASPASDALFPRRPAVSSNYDVVIVGAGASGVSAAIEAARLGSNVALVEETDWIGGQMTAAGVSSMDEGTLDIRGFGIYSEFIERVRAHYATIGKSIGTCYFSSTTACFEPFVGQQILKEMIDAVNSAGPGRIDVFIHSNVSEVIMEGSSVRGVRVANGAELRSKVTVDATEYGDLLPLAKVQYRVGNSASPSIDQNACIQDITYTAVIKKYPQGSMPAYLKISSPPPGYLAARPLFTSFVAPRGSSSASLPMNFAVHNAYRGMPNSADPLDYTGENYAIISKTGVNLANDYPVTAQFIEDKNYRKKIACEAKLKTIQFIYYIQTELDANWSVADDEHYDTAYNRQENDCPNIPDSLKEIEWRLPQIPYVREARRGVGISTISAGDLKRSGTPAVAEKSFPTSVAVGDYSNDLHDCRSAGSIENNLETVSDIQTIPGFFQIPYEVLVPASVNGLLLAEKSISESRIANAATRLQPSMMNVGQAVGAAAGLAIKKGVEPRNLPASEIQKILVFSNATISKMQFTDVPKSNQYWPHVQFISTKNIMVGYGGGIFGVGDTITRAQTAVVLSKVFNLPISPVLSATFQDVPTSHWSSPYVEAIAKSGLTSGCLATPKLYCPDALVTRAEFAVFAARGIGYSNSFIASSQHYSDVPQTHFAYPFIEYLASKGVAINCAKGVNRFCPDDPLTRGEAARFITNIIK